MKTLPVSGAAEYVAGHDYEHNKKPCVFMYSDGYCSVIEYAKTYESALKKAEKWQIKENKAVIKSQKQNK